jgi:hypothetical protein
VRYKPAIDWLVEQHAFGAIGYGLTAEQHETGSSGGAG